MSIAWARHARNITTPLLRDMIRTTMTARSGLCLSLAGCIVSQYELIYRDNQYSSAGGLAAVSISGLPYTGALFYMVRLTDSVSTVNDNTLLTGIVAADSGRQALAH